MFEEGDEKCPGCGKRMFVGMFGGEYCPDDNCPTNMVECDHRCGTLLKKDHGSSTCYGCQLKEEIEKLREMMEKMGREKEVEPLEMQLKKMEEM